MLIISVIHDKKNSELSTSTSKILRDRSLYEHRNPYRRVQTVKQIPDLLRRITLNPYVLQDKWHSLSFRGSTWWTNLLFRQLSVEFRPDPNFCVYCLFVCLFYSYTVPSSREDIRRVIYSGFSCHLCTIEARKWWHDDRLSFKSSSTISLINSLKSSKTIYL
jgi:hypothetical protein